MGKTPGAGGSTGVLKTQNKGVSSDEQGAQRAPYRRA